MIIMCQNFKKTKNLGIHLLVKIEDFWKFGEKWRFLKIWTKLKIFQIWEKLKIFENLVNNEDFWNLIKLEDYSNFSHNRRYLKIRSKLKIFQSLVKIEDFWKLDKNFQILEKNEKRFLCWDLNTPVIWSPIQVLMRLNAA